jgi:hypothetical protein
MPGRWPLRVAVMALCAMAFPAVAAGPFDALQGKLVPSSYCRGLFIVPVSWKDQTLQFVLDTGASHWSVDPDALERLRGKRYASGKKITLRKGMAGPLKLRKLRAWIHELDHLALAVGHEVDGIMGVDTFEELLLTLDYPAREVRVQKGSLPEVNGIDIFRDHGKNRPFLRFEVGDKAVPVLLDSGFTGRLKLHEDDPLEWKVQPTMVHVAVRYAEVELQFAGRLQGLYRLGPLELVEPVTGVTDGTRLAGAELLQHVVLTLDRAQRRVLMRAHDDSRVSSEPYRSLGLGLRPRRNGLEVTGVFSGTPAEQAGIVRGDLVTHVDGQFVHDRSCESLSDAVPGSRRLTLLREGIRFEADVEQAVLIP